MLALAPRMQALGMTEPALARRSKLPADVVSRTLGGTSNSSAEYNALARCLGLSPNAEEWIPVPAFRLQAAREKARFVVAIVQGTMGLEAQGLAPADMASLFDKTVRQFLDSGDRLW